MVKLKAEYIRIVFLFDEIYVDVFINGHLWCKASLLLGNEIVQVLGLLPSYKHEVTVANM